MKTLGLLLLCAFVIVGCSTDDDEQFDFETATIRDVVLPDTLVQGQTYNFDITYNRPTTCHFFAGFDFNKNINERTVAVITAKESRRTDCEIDTTITSVMPLRFFVERDDFYTFRFYQGQDASDNPLFLTVEIPVKHED